MNLSITLDEDQEQIVRNTEGKFLVLAGAGSGKTRALTARIEYLLKSGLADPTNILAVTFTNKAANEIKERLIRALSSNTRNIWIGTFHSVCVKILVANGHHIGIPGNFTILDQDDKNKELKKVMGDTYGAKDIVYYSSLLSRAKDKGLTPDSTEEEFETTGLPRELKTIYADYQKAIRFTNALDFDDLISETIKLLTLHPDLLQAYGERFKYVLMDECQDTSPSQQKLIVMLSHIHNNLMLIGDIDQAIYGWRGAEIDFILKFAKESDVKTLTLAKNYRSQGLIVEAANAIIKNNKNRIDKTSSNIRNAGQRIIYFRPDDPLEEADFVVKVIKLLVKRDKNSFSDFTVLYRTNYQSKLIEEALSRSGVPSIVYGESSFYKKPEIKLALAYIKILLNNYDFINFQKCLDFPKIGVGQKTAERMIEIAVEKNISILDLGPYLDEIPRMQKTAKEGVNKLIDAIKFYQQYVNKVDHARLIKDYFMAVGLTAALDSEELINLEDLIAGLIMWSMDITSETVEDKTLLKYIQELSLIIDDDEEKNRDRVKLMSIHGAKGLEFKVVFLIGVEEGIFPNGTPTTNKLEEERRLFYVALTRAIDRLIITSNRERSTFTNTYTAQESRFIKEIPEELLQRL